MKLIKKIFCRLKPCKHRYRIYQTRLDICNSSSHLMTVHTWKCTKCGKLKTGKSIKEKGGTLK